MSDLHFYPATMQELIRCLQRLPGIGARTAERLALAMLKWPKDDLAAFADRVEHLPERVQYCEECGSFADSQRCRICASSARRSDLLCVVEQPTQIASIERSGAYDGRYHVLGGRLAPLEGIGPEQLRTSQLEERVRAGDVREVILATGSDVEGEATAAFLAERLAPLGVRISRPASGIPVGADLSYADSATMATALTARRNMGEERF